MSQNPLKVYFQQIRFVLLLFLLILIPVLSSAADTYTRQVGEKLSYKVKWGFLRLGTVSMETRSVSKIDSLTLHHIQFKIDSNPLLFFVNMHSVFDCYVDSLARPHKYIATEMDGGEFKKAIYNFNYADSQFSMDYIEYPDSNISRRIVLPLEQPTYDGISLIALSRQLIAGHQTKVVAAFLDTDLGLVELNYKGAAEPIEIDAVENELSTYYVSGIIKMKGIAGVTGPFEGWFAADRQRPPLYAKLKVFVGNVVVELEDWEKWHP